MKKTLLLLLVITVSLTGFAQPDTTKGIHFLPLTLDEAMIKANAEKKPVFLHAFASWCHFCEWMKDSVYPDPEVGAYYNSKFICIRLDMEKEGKNVNRSLRIANYPTMVFYDFNGEVMHREAGKKEKAAFLQLGKDALDSTKQLRTYERKFKSNTETPDEAMTYFRKLQAASIDNQTAINNYLMQIPDEKFTEATSWRIINDFLRDVDQPAMMRVMKSRNELSKAYTSDSVDNRILNNYTNALLMFVQKLDTMSYKEMTQKLKASKLDLADKIVAYAEINKMKLQSRWKEYGPAAASFVEKFCKDDYRRMNEAAFNCSEKVSDTTILAKALTWSQASVKLMDNYKNNHTLASLYYKLKNKEEGLKAVNHAIDLEKKSGLDFKQSTLLKEKIEEIGTEEK
jgi:thioredoxin-related protein